MMNKLKSARLNLVRFLFILPLVAALLLAFRSKRAQTAIPLPAKSAPSPKAIAGPYDEQAIDTAPRKNTVTIHSTNETNLSSDSDYFEVAGDKAVIHLKNGTTEKYDLKDQEQRKKFEEKCGKVIIATTTPISPISAVTVDGVTKMVFPVKVSNNINATVATTATVATSITAPAIAAAPGNVSVVTTISPASIPGEPSVLTVDNNRTIVDGEADPLFTITKNTTREQLEELTRQMTEKGFDLNFKEIKYSEAGKLVSLTGTIKSKDATGSFRFAKSIAKLVVHLVSENNHTYLRIEEVVKHLN